MTQGGGGGRWFTGTPGDGFACNVCHAAAGTVEVAVGGLPLEEGYAPGQAYELSIHWPVAVEHMALIAEMVDDAGATAGSLRVPEIEAARPEEQCSEEGAEGIPSSSAIHSATGRQLVAVIDCGSHAMRMLWTAPSPAVGTVWLSGGLVWSDDDASAAGDIAVSLNTSIPALGSPAVVQTLASTGCSVGRPEVNANWPLLALCVLGAWRARKKHRRDEERGTP